MSEGSTAAIVLAAGGSSRLGRPKQLISLGGKTFIRRSVEAARDATCQPIVVVLGNEAGAVRAELDGFECVLVENQAWRSGIGGSIRSGVETLASYPSVSAAILMTCDQPFADSALLKALIFTAKSEPRPIVASSYESTLGVPTLFARSCFDELLLLGNFEGAKRLIMRDPMRVASIPFPKGEIDIDTVADLERLRSA